MKMIFKAILLLALASLIILPSFSASRVSKIDDDLQWGQPEDGVQMSLSSKDPRTSELQVTLRNVGNHDVNVNLGSMMANGKVQLPDHITINFTDSNGKTRLFKFADKRYGVVAGRLDDYIVPLRVGSMYAVTVTLDQFWCHESNEFEIPLTPGKNRLTAHLDGKGAQLVNLDTSGIKLMNFWLGKVDSNTLILEQ